MNSMPLGGRFPKLVVAHVLFMDIVCFGKRKADKQVLLINTLNGIVENTRTVGQQMRALLCIPSGDGMALAFREDPSAPVRCALEVEKGVHRWSSTVPKEDRFELRMGIHSGAVYLIRDIRMNLNYIGGGINLAHRIMDRGKAGEILVSLDVVQMLSQVSERFARLFRSPLRKLKIKHGEVIKVCNISSKKKKLLSVPKCR